MIYIHDLELNVLRRLRLLGFFTSQKRGGQLFLLAFSHADGIDPLLNSIDTKSGAGILLVPCALAVGSDEVDFFVVSETQLGKEGAGDWVGGRNTDKGKEASACRVMLLVNGSKRGQGRCCFF